MAENEKIVGRGTGQGTMTQKELANKTLLPDRTVSLALSILLDRGLVKRRSSLRDGREKMYSPV